MFSMRGERQDWCVTRHLMCTMRVGVHQSEHGDAQRVPQLPHHQPAVHVRDAFTLSDTGHCASHFVRISGLGWPLFIYFSRKRRHFEERDSNYARPHCNHDAGRQLRAEVIIQQPLERCILLHDQDKFSRGGDICALIKERTDSARHEKWHTGWCIEKSLRSERKDEGYFWSRQCLMRQQLPKMTMMHCSQTFNYWAISCNTGI